MITSSNGDVIKQYKKRIKNTKTWKFEFWRNEIIKRKFDDFFKEQTYVVGLKMFDIFVESFGELWWTLGYIEVVGFHKSCPWPHFLSTFLHPFSTKFKAMNHDLNLLKISQITYLKTGEAKFRFTGKFILKLKFVFWVFWSSVFRVSFSLMTNL